MPDWLDRFREFIAARTAPTDREVALYYFTSREAASMLHIGPQGIYNMCRDGRLDAVKYPVQTHWGVKMTWHISPSSMRWYRERGL